MEKVELLNIIPLIPAVSPRLGEKQNITLRITPDIANGEIGFISNLPIILYEPEDSVATAVSKSFLILPLHTEHLFHKNITLFHMSNMFSEHDGARTESGTMVAGSFHLLSLLV